MSNPKRITLNEIAQLAGVSKTTASIVLNGRGGEFRIKEETRKKIEQIAKENGYRANAYARALQAKRTDVIGLVIPDLTNYGFASTAKTLERLCVENGLQLVIACSDDQPAQEKRVIERLLDRQIDLLITAPTHQESHYYHGIFSHTPLLQLDRYVPDLNAAYIISDDTPKIAELVARIVECYQLKEYFYLGGQRSQSPSQSRLDGFRQGLQNAGLSEQSDWVRHKDYQSESGYQMLSEIVEQQGRLPQALFTASYTLLEGVLRYLTEHKLMDKLLNRQLHLATFDDHQLLNALPFHIHSIKQNHDELAYQTFALIQQKLERKKVESIKVDCEIIWRDSFSF